MIKKVIVMFLGSLVSTACMFISVKCLSPYAIRSVSEISITLSSVFNILLENSPKRIWFLFSIIAALTGIAISIKIILCLLSLFSDDLLDNLISKITIILWISLLLLTIFVLVYYLLFAIIIIILAILLISGFATTGYISNNGGPVHVRGHYRNGSYVRSHNRKRPRL